MSAQVLVPVHALVQAPVRVLAPESVRGLVPAQALASLPVFPALTALQLIEQPKEEKSVFAALLERQKK